MSTTSGGDSGRDGESLLKLEYLGVVDTTGAGEARSVEQVSGGHSSKVVLLPVAHHAPQANDGDAVMTASSILDDGVSPAGRAVIESINEQLFQQWLFGLLGKILWSPQGDRYDLDAVLYDMIIDQDVLDRLAQELTTLFVDYRNTQRVAVIVGVGFSPYGDLLAQAVARQATRVVTASGQAKGGVICLMLSRQSNGSFHCRNMAAAKAALRGQKVLIVAPAVLRELLGEIGAAIQFIEDTLQVLASVIGVAAPFLVGCSDTVVPRNGRTVGRPHPIRTLWQLNNSTRRS